MYSRNDCQGDTCAPAGQRGPLRVGAAPSEPCAKAGSSAPRVHAGGFSIFQSVLCCCALRAAAAAVQAAHHDMRSILGWHA